MYHEKSVQKNAKIKISKSHITFSAHHSYHKWQAQARGRARAQYNKLILIIIIIIIIKKCTYRERGRMFILVFFCVCVW